MTKRKPEEKKINSSVTSSTLHTESSMTKGRKSHQWGLKGENIYKGPKKPHKKKGEKGKPEEQGNTAQSSNNSEGKVSLPTPGEQNTRIPMGFLHTLI